MSHGLPYDYLSVTHYSKNAFSKDKGRLNTIEAKDDYFTNQIGQREGVSPGDVQLVQRHYGCAGILSQWFIFFCNLVSIQWRGKWGSFPSSPTFCPGRSFVYGYRLRSERYTYLGDTTTLNDIELYCSIPNNYEIFER